MRLSQILRKWCSPLWWDNLGGRHVEASQFAGVMGESAMEMVKVSSGGIMAN